MVIIQQKINENAPLKTTIFDKIYTEIILMAKTAKLSISALKQESGIYITYTILTVTLLTLKDLNLPTFIRTRKEHETIK